MLKATNLYAWGDIQDMIQNAEVSTGQVKHAIEEAIQYVLSLLLSYSLSLTTTPTIAVIVITTSSIY